MSSNYPEILTLHQASEMLQVSERTIQRMLKRGEIPGVQIGGQWRFDRDQLKSLVRGEWESGEKSLTQVELVERESMHFGTDVPEAFLDLQQAAKKRLESESDGE